MDIKTLLDPYFTQRPNRMVKGLSMEEYQQWKGINSSLLREGTPYEMLCKLRATAELSPAMRHLVEIQGGDAGTAMQYLHDEKPRMAPRNFATLKEWPPTNTKPKPTDAQMKILERVANGEVDTREFNSAALKKCLENGWIILNAREVEEDGISEDVKHGRIEALQEGKCLHAAVLEPHLFDSGEWEKHWQLSPTKSLCSKMALEAQAEDPTRELITPEIIDTVRRSRDAVWKHKEAARLLLEPGDSEVSFEVFDDVMQCMRKFRIDRLAHNRQVPVIDVKKTRKGLSDGELRNTIRQYGLGVQGAYYMDGLGFYGAARTGYGLIFVTDCEPFMARVVEIAKHEEWQSFICDGRGIYANRLDKFCLNYREGCNFEAFENEGTYPLHNGRTQP